MYHRETTSMKVCRNMLVSLLLCGLATAASSECNPDITRTKPDRIYIDHGDGTVTDRETGLIWMKCSIGQSGTECDIGEAREVNWEQAFAAAGSANSVTGSEYLGWRLPNLKELRSLIERACYQPAINSAIFPNTPSAPTSIYWSSSQGDLGGQTAWGVEFNDGADADWSKDQKTYHHVRLVRGGQ